MLVFWLGAITGIMAFLIIVERCDLNSVTLFFFLVVSTVLSSMAGVFFDSLVCSCQHLNLFCLSSFLAGSAGLSHGKTDFGSLVLGSSGREKSLTAVP